MCLSYKLVENDGGNNITLLWMYKITIFVNRFCWDFATEMRTTRMFEVSENFD